MCDTNEKTIRQVIDSISPFDLDGKGYVTTLENARILAISSGYDDFELDFCFGKYDGDSDYFDVIGIKYGLEEK